MAVVALNQPNSSHAFQPKIVPEPEGAGDSLKAARLVANIAEGIGALSVDIADVTGDIEQLNAASAAQAKHFQQMREGVNEIVEHNHTIHSMASTTREIAHRAHDEAETADREVAGSLEAIQALVETVDAVSARLGGLETAIQRVTRIATDIDQIARQTNLLALNATIEAARAGEAGRGFAVVASEVKALAGQTSKATKEIAATLQALGDEMRALASTSEQGASNANAARNSTALIGKAMHTVNRAVAEVGGNAAHIATAAEDIAGRSEGLASAVTGLTQGVEDSGRTLAAAADRSMRILGRAEAIMFATAKSGFTTIDSKFITAAVETARSIEACFADAIARGELTEGDLFDKDLVPIVGSDPPQFMTRYINFLDRSVTSLHNPVLGLDDRVVFCAPSDHNFLIPCHNPQFSKPQGTDPVWNAAHARNRRKYTDKTATAVVHNTAPFLLQTYRRDMGGGKFALMKDASAPIFVGSRHWGGLRVCYRA